MSCSRRGCRGLGIAVAMWAAGVGSWIPADVGAQEPPDTAAVADSVPGDSLQVADSLAVDSLPPPPVLPRLDSPLGNAGAPGMWEWDRDALNGRRAHTLQELLTELPGVLTIRSGDLGSPMTAFLTGYAGGGLRVYFDGIEHLPMEGSVPDLARIPLSGLDRVRVLRRATGLEIHLERFEHRDARPYSHIEAGTGDLSTNLLRGTFSLPRAVQGKAGLALERLDTRGRGGSAPGAITGGWFRYSLHRGDEAGVQLELRNFSTDRSDSLAVPESVKRTDWTVRGLWAPTDGVLLSGWVTGASFASGDSTVALPSRESARRQLGLRLAGSGAGLRFEATGRINDGVGMADRELSGEASWTSEGGHGLSATAWHESWGGASGTGVDGRAWLSPVPGVRLFAEFGAGERSVPFVPLRPSGTVLDSLLMTLDTRDPGPRFTHRESVRLGAEVGWRGLLLRGAAVEVEADSVWPTGLPFDRGGIVLPQIARRGWEAETRIPLWPRGLALVGAVQMWEDSDDPVAAYFPDYTYHGSLSFHNQYLPTGNFELWVDVGAQGRPEMAVPTYFDPVADPTGTPVVGMVPFYQNWFFRLQLRIVSVNVFATIENLSLRSFNQDVPGALLPRTRSLYGVRWGLWN